jgi:hypothetical protein
MTKRTLVLVVLFTIATTHAAFAWDGPDAWYRAANADNPGGGGILGTGAARDHGITCRECHTDRVDAPTLALQFTFTPSLPSSGGMSSYAAGVRYRVDVTLQNEALGPPCGQYLAHTDGFAATFEGANGASVGMLETDAGVSAASCPTVAQMPTAAGTTGLYSDCKAIFSKGNPDISTWSFYWTAPAGGAVRIFYGGVDGDCDMMSMGDAVVVGTMTLKDPAMAQVSPPPHEETSSPWRLASAFSLVAIVGIVVPLRRRRRPR